MFLVRIKNEDGTTESRLYFSYDKYYSDTWNPGIVVDWFIDFKIRGNNYAERKADAEELAKEFQAFAAENSDLSYGELWHIGNYFEKAARHYGLVGVFRENAII